MDERKRYQNERKFEHWDSMDQGGRRYLSVLENKNSRA